MARIATTGARTGRVRLSRAGLLVGAVLAAAAGLVVSGAEAQTQARPTVDIVARECQNSSGTYVSVGSNRLIDPQMTCRVRYKISVPKSYTGRQMTVKIEPGEPFLAPEIKRTDVLDTDCKTPVTRITADESQGPSDGLVNKPGRTDWWPDRDLHPAYLSTDPATLLLSPHNASGNLVFGWPVWQTGDGDPRVWEASIGIDPPDGALNADDFGCFETSDGGYSSVFYRSAILFEWYLGALPTGSPFATDLVFVAKDNDNGPYSVSHPSARAPRTPPPVAQPPPAAVDPPPAQGPPPQADEALPITDTSAAGTPEAVQAPASGVASCILGEAESRSAWAARLVECLDLRDRAAEGRLVPQSAAAARFSDIAEDPRQDDIVLLARYGLALGCEPGRFCGEGEVSVTERTAVLLAAVSYGLVELSLSS